MMEWFHHQKDPPFNLAPKSILKKESALSQRLTSGPGTSTPTVSSKTELICELLEIIHRISDGSFQSKTDLNISLESSDESWQGDDSSNSSFEEIPPPFPPEGGVYPPTTPYPSSQLKYCPFGEKHDCMECNQ
nr:ORF3 [Torque teno felis virus]